MIPRSYCREALSEAEDIYPHTDIPDDDAPPVNGPEDYGFANGRPNGHDDSIIPELDDLGAGNALNWVDMSNWDNEPVPEREWAIRDRVPLNQAGLFSGEGGTGKSIIELTKNVAHVTGKEWLGSMPEPGPAFYIGAEDDEKEIHIRLAAIVRHYGVTFKELVEGGLHVLCLLGKDATLCAANGKSGRVETTKLYRQIYEAAGDIKPKNISIDTLSRAFAGSEIERAQVYQFANHMQALAKVASGSVTVLSHPSLARHSIGFRHLGIDRMARCLPLQTIPHGREGRGRRATGQRSEAARVQEEPVRAARRHHRGPLPEWSVPARRRYIRSRQGGSRSPSG